MPVVVGPGIKDARSGVFYRYRLAEYPAGADVPFRRDHFAQASPSRSCKSEHIYGETVSRCGPCAYYKFGLSVVGKVVRTDCIFIGFQFIGSVEPDFRVGRGCRHVGLSVNEKDAAFSRRVFHGRDCAAVVVECHHLE